MDNFKVPNCNECFHKEVCKHCGLMLSNLKDGLYEFIDGENANIPNIFTLTLSCKFFRSTQPISPRDFENL